MKFITGLDHIAVTVQNLKKSEAFYTKVLGGRVVWKNAANCLVQFGKKDVMALLVAPAGWPFARLRKLQGKKFSHFGFQARSEKEVFDFARMLERHKVKIIEGPYRRSDGASVYFLDPNQYTLEYFWLRLSSRRKPGSRVTTT
ncbi:MAG: VOC family protein [Candidatus Omnitrophica bacterium]|nr:VOC family protein [Candidatus Omnitrophota bacterium]